MIEFTEKAIKIEKVLKIVKEKLQKKYTKNTVVQQLLLHDPTIVNMALDEYNSCFTIQYGDENAECLRITEGGVFYISKHENVCIYSKEVIQEIWKSCDKEQYTRKLRVLIKCDKNNETKFIGKEYVIYYTSENENTTKESIFTEVIRVLTYFFESVNVPLDALIATYYIDENDNALVDTRTMQELWEHPFPEVPAKILDYRLESIYRRSMGKTFIETIKYGSDNVKSPRFCKVVNTAVSFRKAK